MYGTIMRAKLKPGQKEAYQRWGQEQETQLSQAPATGFVSIEIAFEDKDPNRVVSIIRFKPGSTDRTTQIGMRDEMSGRRRRAREGAHPSVRN